MDATTLIIGFVGMLAGAAVTGAAWYYRNTDELDDRLDDLLRDVSDDARRVTFEPPEISGSVLDYFRVMRHLQRGNRLAKKGYVRWHRLDSTLGAPEWVKPEQDGTGTPKYTIGGQPYYFPKDAMVTDQRTGAWVAVHREGEADPINLRDPAYPGIETDLIERIINLEAENKPPGFLDQFDMSQQAMLYGGMGVLFVIYAAYRYMG